MRIKSESVPVSDQEHALAFYTEKLGFVKKQDIAMGGPENKNHRFLTLVSPDEPDGTELMLESAGEHPATKTYKARWSPRASPSRPSRSTTAGPSTSD